MVAAGAHEHALVVGADVMSSIIDYTDRTTCVLFGDGAGAVVVSRGRRPRRWASSTSRTRSTAAAAPRSACRPAAACGRRRTRPSSSGCTTSSRTARPCSSSPCARPRRSAAACWSATASAPTTSTCSCRTRPTAASSVGRRASSGWPPRRSIINIERYGNTTAATIPLALTDAVAQGRLKKGDLVLLASVGAGFTVGAVLLRWSV